MKSHIVLISLGQSGQDRKIGTFVPRAKHSMGGGTIRTTPLYRRGVLVPSHLDDAEFLNCEKSMLDLGHWKQPKEKPHVCH
jgi:hypothetical protein